jgi:hypothetical protein
MKLTAVVRMFALCVFVAGGTFVVCAQEQHEDAKPAQDEARPEAAKPPDAAHPQEEGKPAKPGEMKGQEQVKPDHDNARPNQEPKASHENMEKPEHAGHAQPAANAQRGHIPDDQFRAHFGREHTVVIHQPVMVGGQPRFQFGGYWFAISDPWPAGWAYTDDCYIDYIDGEYFLFDLLHPGVRVTLVVVE